MEKKCKCGCGSTTIGLALRTIKIPNTILIMWGRPIQTNHSSAHAWAFCTCVTPIWRKSRFLCNAFLRNQSISEIPTNKNMMSKILDDHWTNVLKNLNKKVKSRLYVYNKINIGVLIQSIVFCYFHAFEFMIIYWIGSRKLLGLDIHGESRDIWCWLKRRWNNIVKLFKSFFSQLCLICRLH